MLAAAGVTSVTVHARPVVTVFSTGDEVVPPDTAALMPGQVRDATAVALAALISEAGGDPVPGGIVADDPGLLEAALRPALDDSDVIVVSAGSSVGARDETAAAVGRLGEPGIWCHGLAIKPGKPTLLAECAGAPCREARPPCGPGSIATWRRPRAGSTWSRSGFPAAARARFSACRRCCPCSRRPTDT
jgi:molybdopterin molybdotransferase